MNGETIYYLSWPVDSCDQCKIIAPTPIGIPSTVASCISDSTSGNHKNISKTFRCDCLSDHYFNLENFRCEHVGTIGVAATLVNYLVALPLTVCALVIACRFYLSKQKSSSQRNRSSSSNGLPETLYCGRHINRSMQAGLYMVLFYVLRIIRVSGFVYFGTLFYNLLSIFWVLPILCGIIMFYTLGQITRQFLTPRGSTKAIKCFMNIEVDFPKTIKNTLTILVYAVTIASLVFILLGNYFKNFDYILQIYINTLTLGIFGILTVIFTSFYSYRLTQVLKKSNSHAGENSMQKKKMLLRIKVMMFYIYMLFGYMIGLLLMMYICDVSKANNVTAVNIDVAYSTCSVSFRCLDVYLIIIIVRSLEMKPHSATLPCFCPKRGQPKPSWSRFCKCCYHDPVESSGIDAVAKNEIENGTTISSIRTTFTSLNSWSEQYPSEQGNSE